MTSKTPILLLAFLFGVISLQAQTRTCLSHEVELELRENYPQLGTEEDFENWLRPKVEAYKASIHGRAVTTVPIVFHIIHNGTSVGSGANISATYINAQIDQLNHDFRKTTGTSGDNSNPVGADSEIEFCPATVNPSGGTMAEPGINRINRSAQGWSSPPYARTYIDNTIKPQSIWNPDDYVNIWVMELEGGLLGYAQFPSQSGLPGLNTNGGLASTDGVVILTSSVGSTGTPYPGGGVYNKGRTLTHELGHFFGLRHIWGDANCGNDYCNDTPVASGPASGCPNKTTCDGQQDMVENYMDYSYDDCMNIFTVDQKARMQAVLANSPRRSTLGNSSACSTGGGGGGSCSNTVSNFPYSESFESSFGAWTQSTADDFDWARNSGGTPSSNTGPSSAADGSFYAYVEASSPNYSNKTTILTGPCFDLDGLSNPAFTFEYHIYGAASGVGSLSLEARTSGGSWTSIWSLSGNQGNSWFTANVDLSSYSGNTVELRFVGVTGTTWQGDMAIDQLNISGGTGGGGGNACSGGINSFPYGEGFESNFGSWSQSSGDDFDWTRRSGGTPSSNTGPSSAFAGSTYAYMEASSPNYSTKRAILNGPCIDLSGESSATFSFAYHMYGAAAMGSLDLEVSDDGGSNWTSIWSRSGNQGNSWFTEDVDLSAYTGGSIELRFNGVTGTTWQGDMAIDALSLSTTGGGGGGGCTDISINFTFDNYPEETSWEITDDNGTVVASGGTYGSQADGSSLTLSECLPAGCYDFTIFDSYGDGICCSYGNGSYSVSSSSGTLASGGSFGSSETTNFCVSGSNRETMEQESATISTEVAVAELNVYPNPTRELLNLNYEAAQEGEVQVQVIDLTGRSLQLLPWNVAKGKNTTQLDVSRLGSGTFMLVIIGKEKTLSQRFIVTQ